MKHLSILLVFATTIVFSRAVNLIRNVYPELISNLFQYKNISRVILYEQWHMKDKVYIAKALSEFSILVTFPTDLENNNPNMQQKLFNSELNNIGIVVDMTGPNRKFHLSENKYFKTSYAWLIISDGNFNLTIDFLDKLPLRFDTDMTVANLSDNSMIKLYDVYNPGKIGGGKLNITYMEPWKEFLSTPTTARRSDMNGLKMRVAVFAEHNTKNEPIEVYFMSERDPHLDSYVKLNYFLILQLRDFFNFSMEIVMAEGWAKKDPNGQFMKRTLMGKVAYDLADVMANTLLILKDRVDAAVPIFVTYAFRSGFLFLERNNDDFTSLKFLSPFVANVWFGLLSITALITIFLFINTRYGRFNEIPKLSDFAIPIWGIWCQIGTSLPFRTTSNRIILIFLLFNALIVYNFYTSSVLSSILNYKSKSYSLTDLANSRLNLGSFDEAYAHQMLFETDDPYVPTLKIFNAQRKIQEYCKTYQQGLEKIRHSSYAFHVEYNKAYDFIKNHYEPYEICILREVDTIASGQMSIYVGRNSQYENVFRVGLSKLQQCGILSRGRRIWTFEKPVCQVNFVFEVVDISQVSSYFLVLFIGGICSLIILMFEIVINMHKKLSDTRRNSRNKIILHIRK